MTNALAFFPARSPVDRGLLSVTPDRIGSTGTDTYTLGRDYCEAERFNSTATVNDFPIRIELDREGWREIEAQARKDRGNYGRLEYRPGDSLTYQPGGEKATVATARDMTDEPWTTKPSGASGDQFWDMAQELLRRYGREPGEIPEVMCFDPALFGRFQKVKLSKSVEAEKVLDFFYQGQGSPMLARVGPTFVGLIMPIDREKYVERQPAGADAHLW